MESALPLPALWSPSEYPEGAWLFTNAYWYHHACIRAALEFDETQLLEYVAVRMPGGAHAAAALERLQPRYAGIPIRVYQSPQRVYVPYWDLLPVTADNGSDLPSMDLSGSSSTIGWDVMRLYNVLEGTSLARRLEEFPKTAWNMWPAPNCDYLTCADLDTFLGSISKNFRASLRKARNKLSNMADVQFVSNTERAAVSAALERFLTLETAGWKGDVAGGIANNARVARFYQVLFDEFPNDENTWVELNELWAEGALLASQLCLGRNDTLFILKIAYDEGHPKVSPGNMLLEWVLTRNEGNEGIKFLNLISDSAWHKDWNADHLKNFHIEIYNGTVRGRLLAAARAAQRAVASRFGGQI